MIKKLLISLLLIITSVSALNMERVIQSLYLVETGYFGGDDGVDCNTTFVVTNIQSARFPDTIEVFYEAHQDYYIHGCQADPIPCKILMRSSDFFPMEDSLLCEDEWWGN